MDTKIAFGITTFLRDHLMMECVKTTVNAVPLNSVILVADQGRESEEKKVFVEKHKSVKCTLLPFDCGLSAGRNFLVKQAKELGCEYIVIGADSIFVDESMIYVEELTRCMETSNIDLIGFDLKNRIPWEAFVELIPGKYFELDFVRTKQGAFNSQNVKLIQNDANALIYKCELVKNFFIAKVDALLECPWDEDLKLFEHEDFFWRFKKAGKTVAWTQYCSGSYVDQKPPDYKQYRSRMYSEFKNILQKKYDITGWINYKNYR